VILFQFLKSREVARGTQVVCLRPAGIAGPSTGLLWFWRPLLQSVKAYATGALTGDWAVVVEQRSTRTRSGRVLQAARYRTREDAESAFAALVSDLDHLSD
jgi:hypothetical protein